MKLTLEHELALPSGVLGLSLASDATWALTALADGTLHRVDWKSGKSEAFETKHESFASGCVLLPQNRVAVTCGYDGAMIWHDVETRRMIRRVAVHQFWNWQMALSPNGKLIASTTGQYLPGGWKYEPAAETEPSVKVLDAATGESLITLSHAPPVLSCAFSNDNQYLAAANMLGEVRVWKLEPDAKAAQLVSKWNTPDFTSWGSIKTHHYCGGIYSLGFSPNDTTLVGCGMGPMVDPMAGNGKMTWQRWDWRKGERLDQIKDGQHGSGLMEAIAWHPSSEFFMMAGRQAQGTWNAAVFSAADGSVIHSLDTKKRITQLRFTPDGQFLALAGANGQPARNKEGQWPPWGKLQLYKVTL